MIDYKFPKNTDPYDRSTSVHGRLLYAATCPVCGAVVIPQSAETHTAWHEGGPGSPAKTIE